MFACPNCGVGVGLNDRLCSGCKQPLGIVSLLDFYWNRLRQGVAAAAVIRCAKCPAAVPIGKSNCPSCGHPLSVGVAVDSVVQPPKRRLFAWAKSATPETKLRVRWMYFLFSLAILWWTLAVVQERFPGNIIENSALAVVFLTGLGLLGAMLIPKNVIKVFAKRASRLLKLALVANYLTAMLVMRILTNTWKEQALTLTGVLVATWIAGYFLTQLAWPMKEEVAALYREPDPEPKFNPSSPQGRKVRSD